MAENRTLRVPDMSCGHCEMSVREALGELDGVESVSADHTTGEVEMSYERAKVTEETLQKAIEGAGYTLQR
jgi:copper chaperone